MPHRSYQLSATNGLQRLDPLPEHPQIELLIVDDEPLIAESLVEIFRQHHYHCIAVDSCKAAMTLLNNFCVKLILLDLNMPEMNGYALLKYIQEQDIHTHVIIVSGEGSFEAATQSMRYDFVYDYIHKPYLVKELLNLVAATLAHIDRKAELLTVLPGTEHSLSTLRLFINKSPHIYFLLCPEGRFNFVNEVISEVLGYKSNEMQGRHYSELIVREDHERAKLFFDSCFRSREGSYSDEFKFYANTAESSRKLSLQANYLSTNGNPLNKYISSAKTEWLYGSLRQIEAPVSGPEQESLLVKAIEQNPHLIFITDADGKIQYANQKFTELTGYLHQEIIGKAPAVFSSGETSPELYRSMQECLRDGQVWRGILKNQRKNGECYWVREAISPLFDETGNITHFVAMLEELNAQENSA